MLTDEDKKARIQTGMAESGQSGSACHTESF
jgi:hypothetical protein